METEGQSDIILVLKMYLLINVILKECRFKMDDCIIIILCYIKV